MYVSCMILLKQAFDWRMLWYAKPMQQKTSAWPLFGIRETETSTGSWYIHTKYLMYWDICKSAYSDLIQWRSKDFEMPGQRKLWHTPHVHRHESLSYQRAFWEAVRPVEGAYPLLLQLIVACQNFYPDAKIAPRLLKSTSWWGLHGIQKL